MRTKTLRNKLVDPQGNPLANVPVTVQLIGNWLSTEDPLVEVLSRGVTVYTDATGTWQVTLIPNDLLHNPNSVYIVTEGNIGDPYYHSHRVRIKASHPDIVNLSDVIVVPTTPAVVQPYLFPFIRRAKAATATSWLETELTIDAVTNLAVVQDDSSRTIKILGLQLVAGAGITITPLTPQPNEGARLQISATATGGGPHTHPLSDLQPSGAVTGNVVKFDGTYWVPGWVNWTEVQNKPTTFTPSAHTHPLADLQPSGATAGQFAKFNGTQWIPANIDWADVQNKPGLLYTPAPATNIYPELVPFWNGTQINWRDVRWNDITQKPTAFPPSAHTHPLADLQAGTATAGDVVKFNGTNWVNGRVDWTEIINKPSTFPPSTHTHTKADITDFAHTHPLTDLQAGTATAGDVVKFNGTRWVNGRVDWTEITNKPAVELQTNKGVANGYAPLDANAKVPLAHIPSGVDAGKLQGVPIATTAPTNGQVLTYDGTAGQWKPQNPPAGGGGGTPGGSNGQIQYNANGAFGGAAYFVWDATNNQAMLTSDPATSTTTMQPSKALVWQGAYWNGTQSVPLAFKAWTEVTATTGVKSRLRWVTPTGVDVWYWTEDGNVYNIYPAGTPRWTWWGVDTTNYYIRIGGWRHTIECFDSNAYGGKLQIQSSGSAQGWQLWADKGIVLGDRSYTQWGIRIDSGMAWRAITVTANTTLDGKTIVVFANASAGAITLNLPDITYLANNFVHYNRLYIIKKIDSTANAVTIVPYGTQTIEGASSYQLTAQNQVVWILNDGSSDWKIIAKYP